MNEDETYVQAQQRTYRSVMTFLSDPRVTGTIGAIGGGVAGYFIADAHTPKDISEGLEAALAIAGTVAGAGIGSLVGPYTTGLRIILEDIDKSW